MDHKVVFLVWGEAGLGIQIRNFRKLDPDLH
jgi:hypothetical protein